ncbi:MAG TPA: sigma-70 family RNA polymerase sigma factor [Acidimicrobiales bacterium]
MELLEQVRKGDEAAFTELFARHRAVARRVALTYRCPGDPDDLVNEAFEKVFAAVRRGHGPTDAFRAYLLVTMRRLAADHAERPKDERLDDVPEAVAAAAAEAPLDTEERTLITRAFESLPDRWQAVLWYTAVEGRSPRELAPLLGVSANAVSALAYRAREQLRQAYLQAHLQTWSRPQCEPHRSLLGAYVRDGQSRRERAATQRHLDSCPSCQGLVAELNEVNSMLVRSVVPLFPASALAKAAPAVAGAAGAGAAATAGGAGAGSGLLSNAFGEGAAQAARRGLASLAGIKQAGATVGSIAAATGLLVGLAGMGVFMAGDGDGAPDVAMLTAAPDTTLAPATTTAPPAAAAAPGTTAPPAVAAATDQCHLLDVEAELDGSALTAGDGLDDQLVSLNVDTPLTRALGGEGSGDGDQGGSPASPCATAEGEGALSIGLDTDLGGDDGQLADVDLEVLDLEVKIELGTGATALDVGLPDVCELIDAGQTVICALDSLTPSNIALLLDTAGADTGATISITRNGRTIDVKTVDVLGAVGDLAEGILGGTPPTTTGPGATTGATTGPNASTTTSSTGNGLAGALSSLLPQG